MGNVIARSREKMIPRIKLTGCNCEMYVELATSAVQKGQMTRIQALCGCPHHKTCDGSRCQFRRELALIQKKSTAN